MWTNRRIWRKALRLNRQFAFDSYRVIRHFGVVKLGVLDVRIAPIYITLAGMNQLTAKLLYADTNSLIYAYEKDEPAWRALFDEHFSAGYRLAPTEENLLEFAQSSTTQVALNLASRVVDLNPIWLRSFTDIQADEVRGFVDHHRNEDSIPIPEIYRSSFEAVSQIGERQAPNPNQFVEIFSSESAKSKVRAIRREHASVLDELTRSTASGALTKHHLELAFRSSISMRLRKGSDRTPPLADPRLEEAVEFCLKHRKCLLRACPSFAAEHHLANYRSSSPKRNARLPDSVDLTATVAALPYVQTLITNDGFLFAGLEYVKRKVASITTKLVRSPRTARN